MAYILNPADVAKAIGVQCGGSAVTGTETALLAVLDLLLPRVEDLMDVASLTYGETTDTFQYFDDSTDVVPHGSPYLRLSNGYIENSEDHPVTILDPDGEAVEPDWIDLRYGVIKLKSWKVGKYTVAYYSGFQSSEAEEEGDPVFFLNVPTWIKGVVTTLMVQFYRTNEKAFRVPENVSYGAIMEALDKELKRRVYQRWQRSRVGEWAVTSVRTDGMLT